MLPNRTLLRGAEGWPPRLSGIPDAPERLRVRGDLGPPAERRVAVVGSRRADPYGLDLAREIARGLARAGVCVVSGGAEGVDGAAHEAALQGGGRTIAVLGCGLDVVYPAGHARLFRRIVEGGGALASEYDDGDEPARWRFPARNRIVSGMSDAVVVVRAGERSGALITADWAVKQGVTVLAVPGDVREEGSAGPTKLLRAGARPVASAEHVLAEIGLAGQLALRVEDATPRLVGSEASAWRALGRSPAHADEIARAAGLGPGQALAALLSLELQGLCEQRPGHYFLRSR